MDPLFPELPENLSELDDERLAALVEEHLSAQRLVRENNAEFIGDLTAPQIIEQLRIGRDQLAALRAEQDVRAEAIENFESVVAELTSDAVEAIEETEDASEGEEAEAVEELAAETDDDEEGEEDESEEAAIEQPVVASAEPVYRRRPPMPVGQRAGTPVVVAEEEGAFLLTASGNEGIRPGQALDRETLALAMIEKARRLGPPKKHERGIEERFLIASASYKFPEERILRSTEIDLNAKKIRGLLNTEGEPLVASGGLCAPLTPIYSIPNFAVRSRPVRDALPSFNADRGGLNLPDPSYIGDITTAISLISEENDALGGTFAGKSCQPFNCMDYNETALYIIAHCREYGNMNARAWPESIAHENDLTMAGHARVAESFLLERIKAQSINVTTADVYSTTHDLIYAITRAASGIRFRLRTGDGVRLRALLPSWVPDMMVADIAATQFDRFKSQAAVTAILRQAGIEPSFYIDTPTTGVTQGFAAETAGTLDDFPDVIQWALFVEGAFIHLDGGTLELGIVRDSTLNTTNDFQVFGESFENVARVGPAQGALWLTSTVCPSGEFPSLTTALTC